MSLDRSVLAAQAASSKSLDEVVLLDVGDLIGITDHFVISSGHNDRQVRAIVDEVVVVLKGVGVAPLRREGESDATWVLLDYGDFVIHVLSAEARQLYGLERLWSDATRLDWELVAAGAPTSGR